MKNFLYYILLASSCLIFSCNGNGSGTKKNNDSSYSGLEGTQEESSRLTGNGNAPVDTSSGQTAKKSPSKDSSKSSRDSSHIK